MWVGPQRYTDMTFTTKMAEEPHSGLLGPTLRVSTGTTASSTCSSGVWERGSVGGKGEGGGGGVGAYCFPCNTKGRQHAADTLRVVCQWYFIWYQSGDHMFTATTDEVALACSLGCGS